MAFEVEYFTINPTQSAAKSVDMTGTPVDTADVVMDLIGGTAQAINGDFGVDSTTDSTTRVKWGGFNLDGTLTTGDNIRLIYDQS